LARRQRLDPVLLHRLGVELGHRLVLVGPRRSASRGRCGPSRTLAPGTLPLRNPGTFSSRPRRASGPLDPPGQARRRSTTTLILTLVASTGSTVLRTGCPPDGIGRPSLPEGSYSRGASDVPRGLPAETALPGGGQYTRRLRAKAPGRSASAGASRSRPERRRSRSRRAPPPTAPDDRAPASHWPRARRGGAG